MWVFVYKVSVKVSNVKFMDLSLLGAALMRADRQTHKKRT